MGDRDHTSIEQATHPHIFSFPHLPSSVDNIMIHQVAENITHLTQFNLKNILAHIRYSVNISLVNK